MKIKERLEKETVSRLRQLAKQLNLAGYFRKKKQELIDFIITNRSLKEITAALDVKVLWWKQIKDFTHFYGAITAIGLIVGVIAIFLAFSFKESTKEIDERKDQKDKYYHNLIEKQEMNRQGFPNVYINGLGENPLLKHSFKEGRKLEKESRFKDAIKEFKTCLLHPAATNSNKVAAHNLIGICYYTLSALKDAERHYESALKISDNVKDDIEKLKGKSAALGNIGLIYSDLGELQKALKLQREALVISQKVGNEQGVAAAFGNIGTIYYNLGYPQKALKCLNEALEIHHKIGSEKGVGTALGNIGVIYRDLNEPQKALIYLNESLTIFKRIGTRTQINILSTEIKHIREKQSRPAGNTP